MVYKWFKLNEYSSKVSTYFTFRIYCIHVLWQGCPKLCHFWFRKLWFWILFNFSPTSSLSPRWPNALQSHTIGDRAGSGSKSRLYMSSQICNRCCRGWETYLIANDYKWQLPNICFQRLVKGLSVWIMSNFTWIYCFFRNHTHTTTSYSYLARQSARKKRDHEHRSGIDFPISQKILIYEYSQNTLIQDELFSGNSNTWQQGIITLFSGFLTLHAVFYDSTLPHSYSLLDCNKQQAM